jgi:excisionase family DNA binding protein
LSAITTAVPDTSTQAAQPFLRLLCAEELAEIMSCSVSHVYELAARGEIPCLRIGRLVRFELDPVLEALRADGGER